MKGIVDPGRAPSPSPDGIALAFVDHEGAIRRTDLEARVPIGLPCEGLAWRPRPDPDLSCFERGLFWLSDQRNKKGVWDNIPGDNATRADLTLTSLAGLVHLQEGRSPGESPLREIRKYLLWKIDHLEDMENLETPEHFRSHLCFQLPFVLMFLSELELSNRGSGVEAPARKLIELLQEYQFRDGGWAYSKAEEPDLEKDPTGARKTLLATTTTCVLALALAREAGFEVPEKTLKNGLLYLKGCANQDGGFRYRLDPRATRFARQHWPSYHGATLIALSSLLVAEGRKSPEFRKGRKHLGEAWKNLLARSDSEHYWFWVFFGKVFSIRMGGEFERNWNEACRERMRRDQDAGGGWKDRFKEGMTRPDVRRLGRLFASCTALLCLSPRKGSLGLLQKE